MVHFVTSQERLTSQYDCSTSYTSTESACSDQKISTAELVLTFEFQPDLRYCGRARGHKDFASVCFAALSPSVDNRAAGRSLLGVCTRHIIALSVRLPRKLVACLEPPIALDADAVAQSARKSHSNLQVLPVGSSFGGRKQRYVWDGQAIKVIDTEELATKQTKRQHFLAQLRDMSDSVRAAFLPEKDLVTPDYWAYSFWRNSHRFFSSAITVFATQSLLQAVGVGAKNSLPAAAGINWVLKDGLGRLGRLSVSTRFGTSFDSDLKLCAVQTLITLQRFRFATSLVYSASVALEFVTPMAPQYFLLLASLANVGKSVGLATHISTQPSFVKNFARQDNLSDLTAKAQAQQMIADNAGLALAVTLTFACRNDPRARKLLPLLAFPLLAVGDLCSIYRELKSIHLHNLNRQRAEILADVWLEAGRIPSPAEVSKEERVLLPYRRADGGLPLHIASLDQTVTTPQQLESLLQQHRGDKFVMAYQQNELTALQQRLPFGKKLAGGFPGRVAMTLQDGATTTDILTGVLQAAFFRQLVAGTKGQPYSKAPPRHNPHLPQQPSSSQSAATTPSTTVSAKTAGQAKGYTSAPSPPLSSSTASSSASSTADLERLLAESLKHARADVKRFLKDTQQAGWQTHPLMLSKTERASFGMAD